MPGKLVTRTSLGRAICQRRQEKGIACRHYTLRKAAKVSGRRTPAVHECEREAQALIRIVTAARAASRDLRDRNQQ